MADLSVDTAGLDAAAASAAGIANSLAGRDGGSSAGNQPSHAGVAAIRASTMSARRAQSARGGQHSSSMHGAAAVYTETDDGEADTITTTI